MTEVGRVEIAADVLIIYGADCGTEILHIELRDLVKLLSDDELQKLVDATGLCDYCRR